MKKTEREVFRCSPKTKELLESTAKERNLSMSEYIIGLIEKDVYSRSHEQQIEKSLEENQFITELLINPNLPNKSKQLIGKELQKYVRHTN